MRSFPIAMAVLFFLAPPASADPHARACLETMIELYKLRVGAVRLVDLADVDISDSTVFVDGNGHTVMRLRQRIGDDVYEGTAVFRVAPFGGIQDAPIDVIGELTVRHNGNVVGTRELRGNRMPLTDTMLAMQAKGEAKGRERFAQTFDPRDLGYAIDEFHVYAGAVEAVCHLPNEHHRHVRYEMVQNGKYKIRTFVITKEGTIESDETHDDVATIPFPEAVRDAERARLELRDSTARIVMRDEAILFDDVAAVERIAADLATRRRGDPLPVRLGLAVALAMVEHPRIVDFVREGRDYYSNHSLATIRAVLRGEEHLYDTVGDDPRQQRFMRIATNLQVLRERGYAAEAAVLTDRLLAALHH